MSSFRNAVMWAGLALIVVLIFLSIYGAFIGAERAQKIFNTAPAAVYWSAFILIQATGQGCLPFFDTLRVHTCSGGRYVELGSRA
jgi:hypothetical protein